MNPDIPQSPDTRMVAEQVDRGEITDLLQEFSRGNEDAMDRLMPLVYEELQRQAHAYLRRERKNHTLQTTALVHEAFLRLIDQNRVDWRNRSHFYAVAATMMRRILVNYARNRGRVKRGGSAQVLQLNEEIDAPARGNEIDLIELDEALDLLAERDDRSAKVLELRYFGGLTIDETAEAMGISTATVERDWDFARAWLKVKLEG